MVTGKISVYGTAALLLAILVAASLQVAGAGAGVTPAGSFSSAGFGNSSLAGGFGGYGIGPGGIGSGLGFDSWGWGGIGPNGIVAPGASGCTRPGKARGALWSFWQPGPF